ncbi:PAAR repeat-containing protein [Caballeronia glebae]|uniref:PAAR repeat-containing protein n=1 Tax=Caballeronia glebae TaxID=1777143 RepID=A0A158CVV0_9BURK|nr:PAAR domain-containing protein [Caballeronia glebae]SAK86503.1 PAAR repeat-containing protein [Caballeronia glebae]
MAKMMALKGNLTTTGGRVLDGDDSMLDDGTPIARHMGLASCPRCGKNGAILGSASNWGFGGTRGVVDGDIVMCDCPRGANRVIAHSTIFDE